RIRPRPRRSARRPQEAAPPSGSGAPQRDRLTDQADVAVLGIGHVLGDAKVLHLVFLEYLVDGIDRAAGYAGRIVVLDHFLLDQGVDFGIDRIAVLGAGWRGCVFGTAWKVGGPDGLSTALPDLAAGGGEVDVAVRGFEHASRDAGGWLLPAWLATSFSISQRAAWKSSM